MEKSNVNNVVVPIIDGRDPAWQIEQVVALVRQKQVRVHLLSIQAALPRHVSRFFKHAELAAFHRDNGLLVLAPIARRLDDAGVVYQSHVTVGPKAEAILRFAKAHDCGRIVMEEDSGNWMSALGLGSINSQVQHLMKARHLGLSLGGA